MWEWDPSLYAGSAAHYARGRIAYPPALAAAMASALKLDGTGRLLDVGCGPGSLTLSLAPHFAEAVGVDADQGMIEEATRLSTAVPHVRWLHLRAEDLPAGLGKFRLVTFAQSFHWLDRPRVAATVRTMLTPDGACAHVHATTHQGVPDENALPNPRPPHEAITDLVREYLGPVRRAGRDTLPNGTPGGESAIYRAAGFTGPTRLTVPGTTVTRSTDEVVAAVFSLSGSTPHLFGDHRPAFESDLRRMLLNASPTGTFSERTHEIAVDIWRP